MCFFPNREEVSTRALWRKDSIAGCSEVHQRMRFVFELEGVVQRRHELFHNRIELKSNQQSIRDAVRGIEPPPRALFAQARPPQSELGLIFDAPRPEELTFTRSSGSRRDSGRRLVFVANRQRESQPRLQICEQGQGKKRELHQQQSQFGQFSGHGQLPLAQQGHLHSPSWQGGQAHFPLAQQGQDFSSMTCILPMF